MKEDRIYLTILFCYLAASGRLIERYNTPEKADELIVKAREELIDRLNDGEKPLEICAEWFDLELDIIETLIP